jgi:hypothetical protein
MAARSMVERLLADKATAERMREFAQSVDAAQCSARNEALWAIVQEEVDAEIERRFVAMVATCTSGIPVTLAVDTDVMRDRKRWLLGLTVNGSPVFSVAYLSRVELRDKDERDVMAEVIRQLGVQIAVTLLDGLKAP